MQNYLLEVEKHQAVSALQLQLPVLLQHMREQGEITKRLAQIIMLGKHKIEIVIDPNASGISLEEPRPVAATSGSRSGGSFAWVWWLIGIGLLIVWLMSHK